MRLELLAAVGLTTACGGRVPNVPLPDAAADDCPTVGIDVGDCAPQFTLPNTEGELVSLSDVIGDRVLVVGSSLW